MPLPRSFLMWASLLLAVPTGALAQVCRGTMPLSGISLGHVSAAASLFDGGKTYGGAVTLGSSLFGSASYNLTKYEAGTDLHMNTVGGSLGYEITPEESGLSVCPVANVGYGFGYQLVGLDLTVLAISGGASFGYRVELEPDVFVVPSVELGLARDRVHSDAGASGTSTSHETYGLVTLSMGFLMRRQHASMAPSIQLPVSADGRTARFGLSLAFGFGGGA